jgi:hypothetical protein
MAIETGRFSSQRDEKDASAIRLLAAILSGAYQCWIIFEEGSGGRELHAIGLTSLSVDRVTEEKMLVVDTLFAYRPFNSSLSEDCMNKLVSFAKVNDCTAISAWTMNPGAERLMLSVGFNKSRQEYRVYI